MDLLRETSEEALVGAWALASMDRLRKSSNAALGSACTLIEKERETRRLVETANALLCRKISVLEGQIQTLVGTLSRIVEGFEENHVRLQHSGSRTFWRNK